MAANWNLVGKVAECLQHRPDQKFTAREIAAWIFENYEEDCRDKQNRSKATTPPLDTDAALLQQLVADIGANRSGIQKKHPNIKTTDEWPKKYYCTEESATERVIRVGITPVAAEVSTPVVAETTSDELNLKDHELYPVLAEFLWLRFNIYSKRIDEKRSLNSPCAGGKKWLSPALVGMEDMSRDWLHEVKDFVQLYSGKKTKLWSFAVTTQLDQFNIRETYFQAVSNSSWAHFGYLVSREVVGDETRKKLELLTQLHGIGFMQLNVAQPAASKIIFTAKERTELDFDRVNRLAEKNKDFRDYIKAVHEFHQIGRVHAVNWDS